MFRSESGFTLIELLVVMLLMAMSLSIIVPLTVEQVDSARARAERQKVIIALDRLKATAFFTSSSQTMLFEGKEVKQQSTDNILILNYIAFEPATLKIHSDGWIDNTYITAYINEKKWFLQLQNETAEWVNAD